MAGAAHGQYNASLPSVATGEWLPLQLTNTGSLRVANTALGGTGADGTSNTLAFMNTSGQATVGLLATAQYHFNGTTWDRITVPNQAHRLLSAAATTNATSVKASAGKVHKIVATVAAAADKFLKFYNKASAPVVGTDTPVLTLLLPASAKNIIIPLDGQYFSAGIAYAITGAAPDADTTALAAGDVTTLNITYA